MRSAAGCGTLARMNLATESPLLLDFQAADEEAAIRMVAGLLEHHPAVLNFAAFQTAVLERQRIQAPVLGNGIALPHARTPAVSEIVFAIGRCREPVPFRGAGDPVRLIFLYGAPPGLLVESLATVAQLAKKLRQPEILAGLSDAGNEEEFREWLA